MTISRKRTLVASAPNRWNFETNLVADFLICFAMLSSHAQAPSSTAPNGKMLMPKDYREWIFLSSGLGMTYTPSSTPNPESQFPDNVFVNPEAYQSYLKNGTWPDKTVLVLGVRASDSKVSINKDGRVRANVVGVEAHVKDAAHGGWAFYSFGDGTQQVGTLLPKTATYITHAMNRTQQSIPHLFSFTPRQLISPKRKALSQISLAGNYTQAIRAGRSRKIRRHRPRACSSFSMVTSPEVYCRHDHVLHDVGKTEDLAKVTAGDHIHADVVVNADEMHLENIAVMDSPKRSNPHSRLLLRNPLRESSYESRIKRHALAKTPTLRAALHPPRC